MEVEQVIEIGEFIGSLEDSLVRDCNEVGVTSIKGEEDLNEVADYFKDMGYDTKIGKNYINKEDGVFYYKLNIINKT